MEYIHDMNLDKVCECGRIHSTEIDCVDFTDDALLQLPIQVKKLSAENVYVIFDESTYNAAGRIVEDILTNSNIKYNKLILKGEVHADAYNIGNVLLRAEPIPDMFLAVGSGSINDLTRFCAHRLNRDYGIVATAPSMDGYASQVSPITIDGLKVTYITVSPKFVLSTPGILATAPNELKGWGLGDMLGKRVALIDWQLARYLLDEYFCENVYNTMQTALNICIDSIGSDTEDVNLINGLVLAGLAMQMVGFSRPASGAEHHLSHYLEMKDIWEGKKANSHGIKVGMGTYFVLQIYKNFFARLPKSQGMKSKKQWRADIHKGYGEVADLIIGYNEDSMLCDDDVGGIYEKLMEHKDYFISELNRPEMQPSAIIDVMDTVGADIRPSSLGYSKDDILNGLLNCVEIRPRFTILRLLQSFGLLEEYVREAVEELYE